MYGGVAHPPLCNELLCLNWSIFFLPVLCLSCSCKAIHRYLKCLEPSERINTGHDTCGRVVLTLISHRAVPCGFESSKPSERINTLVWHLWWGSVFFLFERPFGILIALSLVKELTPWHNPCGREMFSFSSNNPMALWHLWPEGVSFLFEWVVGVLRLLRANLVKYFSTPTWLLIFYW